MADVKFIPVVYEHAVRFIQSEPLQVSMDPELLARAFEKTYLFYQHQPIVVGVDLYNLEAEAYGAMVRATSGGVPSVPTPPLSTWSEILDLPPLDPENQGRFWVNLRAAQTLRSKFPEAEICLPISGPFTIAAILTGMESLLISAITDADLTRRGLEKLSVQQLNLIDFYLSHNFPVILFESTASPPFISPEMFRTLVAPFLQKMVGHIREKRNDSVPIIIGGDTTSIVEDLLMTGTRYIICPREVDQRRFLQKVSRNSGVTVRLNMNPGLFVHADKTALKNEAEYLLDIAKDYPNTEIGTGVLPIQADPETVLFVRKLIEQA